MKSADEYQQISSSLYFWQAYEPSVKADLSCCALVLDSGLVFVDPIPLEKTALAELAEMAPPCAIILTNANHERAAAEYRKRFGIPIYAQVDARDQLQADHWVEDGRVIHECLKVVALPGFGVGEIALYWDAGEGVLMMGDALINLGSTEFALLPEKYCTDLKLGRQSLKKLMQLDFETMTFAHGTPILKGAKTRLQELL
jgi:glyoxylase-like metal-dependent hydrolase (beta-lactamase superfamily II)